MKLFRNLNLFLVLSIVVAHENSESTKSCDNLHEAAKCGIRNKNGIGPELTNNAEFGEFPWMIQICMRSSEGKVHVVCGGSLITPNVVITAAVCVNKINISDLSIRAGEWNTETTDRVLYQDRDILDIIIHPDYGPNTIYVHNNIALMILKTPLDKAKHTGTICLPLQGLATQANGCLVTGWGTVNVSDFKQSAILKKIEVSMITNDVCQDVLRSTDLGPTFNLHDSSVCTRNAKDANICYGDGGGPLICPDPNNAERYKLAGIVSWSIGCGENGLPTVYTDVAKFHNWVDKEMENLNIDRLPYIMDNITATPDSQIEIENTSRAL